MFASTKTTTNPPSKPSASGPNGGATTTSNANHRSRTIIAAQASLLVLGLDFDWYRAVQAIVVHPSEIVQREPQPGPIEAGSTMIGASDAELRRIRGTESGARLRHPSGCLRQVEVAFLRKRHVSRQLWVAEALPPFGEGRVLLDALLHDPLRIGERLAQVRQCGEEHRVLGNEVYETR